MRRPFSRVWESKAVQIAAIYNRTVYERGVVISIGLRSGDWERSCGFLLLLGLICGMTFLGIESKKMDSVITIKGQVTIPKEVREYLGLKPGDRLKFFFHPDGSVVLLPKVPARALRGMLLSRRRRPVSIDAMTRAVAEGASQQIVRRQRTR